MRSLSPRAEERLRRQASAWFAKLRRPDGARHQAAFETWRTADARRHTAYERLVQRWDGAEILVGSSVGRPISDSGRSCPGAWSPLALAGLSTGCLVIALAGGLVASGAGDPWWLLLTGGQRLATGVSEIRRLTLEDGSSVVLDTDSEVAERVDPRARRVDLIRGRARFNVAQDARRPFTVIAGDGLVSARSAVFDVTVSADRALAVTPVSGVVDVDLHPAFHTHSHTRLKPGQRLAYGNAHPIAQVGAALSQDALWPTGLLNFQDTPLGDAVAAANRYSRQKIVLADPALSGLQVSGLFRATATAEFAASVAAMFNLKLERQDNGDFVLQDRPS